MSVLTDEVIVLRPVQSEDLGWLVDNQDPEMADRFEWTGAMSRQSLEQVVARWVESWEVDGPERNFAIVDAESLDVVGDCEVELRPDDYVHVMYTVFESFRGRGIATRAVALLAQYAAAAFPNRPMLFRIHPDNAASIRVAESVGAALAGEELSATGRRIWRWMLDPPTEPTRDAAAGDAGPNEVLGAPLRSRQLLSSAAQMAVTTGALPPFW